MVVVVVVVSVCVWGGGGGGDANGNQDGVPGTGVSLRQAGKEMIESGIPKVRGREPGEKGENFAALPQRKEREPGEKGIREAGNSGLPCLSQRSQEKPTSPTVSRALKITISKKRIGNITRDTVTKQMRGDKVRGKLIGTFHRFSMFEASLSSNGHEGEIFKSNVTAVLLYGCETWHMTKNDASTLHAFVHIKRSLMKIYWPMKVSNAEIRNRANISTISEQIYRRRWRFIGHILSMDANQYPKTALTWAPEGKKSHGRPRVI